MKRYILILSLFIISCSGSKKVAEEDLRPDWVKQKPIVPGYYIGIGRANKVGTTPQYTAKARENALADMAGDISSEVSATSVLHKIEDKYGITESFSERIEINSEDYFAGFDPVDSYETENYFWVYYRINKSTYHEMKEKKKQSAISNGKSKYLSAMEQIQKGNAKEAIAFSLQGLQAIKEYLAEETTTEINNEKTDLGNELYGFLSNTIKNLSIESLQENVKVVRNESNSKHIYFKTFYENQTVSTIPIKFSYSGGFLKTDRISSDANGQATLELETIRSKNNSENITATIDLKEIAFQSVDDLFIRGIMKNFTPPKTVVDINIESPAITLSFDNSPCQKDDCSRIASTFSKIVLQNGYKEEQGANYVVKLNYKYQKGESAGNLTSSIITGKVSLFRKGNLIWQKELSELKGVGQSYQQAEQEAFNELVNILDRRYFSQLFDDL